MADVQDYFCPDVGVETRKPLGNSTEMVPNTNSTSFVYPLISNTSSRMEDKSNSPFPLNPISLKEVLQKIEVIICPILLIIGGLPHQHNHNFLSSFLSKKETFAEPPTFLQQTVVASGFRPLIKTHLVEVDDQSGLFYSFLSGIQYYLRINSLRITRSHKSQNVFESNTLTKSADKICEYLDLKINGEAEKNKKIAEFEEALPRGLALVSRWELTSDRTVVIRFLECFRTHLFNCYSWLIVDLEEDIDKLHFAPEQLPKHHPFATRWRSHLEYIVRSASLSDCPQMKRTKVCRLFGFHNNMSEETLKTRIEMLKEEAENAATQYGLSELFDFEVVPVNTESPKEAYKQFREFLSIRKPQQTIPLSWPFLRIALLVQNSIFMKYSDLQELANECEVELDEFLKFYTSSGSILNVKQVDKESNLVIIDPVRFFQKLCKMFSKPIEFGIITPSKAQSLVGEEYEKFFDVLVSVGLSSRVSKEKLGDSNVFVNEEFVYYVSLLRGGNFVEECHPKSVQLVTGLKTPTVNMQIGFTNYFLHNLSNVVLVPCDPLNTTYFKLNRRGSAFGIRLVAQGDVVEIRLEPNDSLEDMDLVCSSIIDGAESIAMLQSKRGGKVQYHFCYLCLRGKKSFPVCVQQKCHIFSGKLLINNCSDCSIDDNEVGKMNFHQHFKIALEKNPIKSQFKLSEDVTLEDAMMLAGKIKEKDAGLFFQMLLKTAQDGPLSEEELSWQVLKLIMEWKEVKKGFSKRELVRILLGTKAGVLCNSTQEQRERFRLLARNLDIQSYATSMQSDHNRLLEK